jgi:hypothetical protein
MRPVGAGRRVAIVQRATGRPVSVFNTDQGSQFTSEAFTRMLLDHGIEISMDGRGRCHNNIFVERLCWTVKHEWVCLRPAANALEQKRSLAAFFDWYNGPRPHQSLGWQTPDEVSRDVLDAELRQRAAELRQHRLRHPPASFRRLEVVAATIGVERAEQPCCATTSRTPRRLDAVPSSFTRKAEYSAPVAILHRHHHVLLAAVPRQPGVRRGILVQHHAHHRTPWPLLAMRRARLGRRHQTRAVQMQLGHRVAQRVVVPLPQLLVEMLHREAAVGLAIQTQHPLDLRHRSAPR